MALFLADALSGCQVCTDQRFSFKYIICHSEIFVNFLFVEATVQIFVHVLRYTKAGGVYMSTYEKLQDQTCADGIDVMDYKFNSPNIKGLYCNSTVAINNSI